MKILPQPHVYRTMSKDVTAYKRVVIVINLKYFKNLITGGYTTDHTFGWAFYFK